MIQVSQNSSHYSPGPQNVTGSWLACWPWCRPGREETTAWSPRRCPRSHPVTGQTNGPMKKPPYKKTLKPLSPPQTTHSIHDVASLQDQVEDGMKFLTGHQLCRRGEGERGWCERGGEENVLCSLSACSGCLPNIPKGKRKKTYITSILHKYLYQQTYLYQCCQ